MASLIGSGFFLVLVIAAVLVFLHFVPIGLWISAIAANVPVGIFTLVGMRMRRVPPSKIIMPLIKANKAGLDVSANQLEAHYLAGGNVDKVVDALIAAHRAQIPLAFERSAAIDLAGRDVLEAVQMSVNPKVIETPIVSAVAKNGIELKIKARVTVRANIDRLVGGAGEPTIIARVGEGIVTTVGSSESHSDVLANPDDISKTVLGKGLDYRRRAADRPGGGGQAHCPGQSRGAPGHGRGQGAGNEGLYPGDGGQGGGGPGRGAPCFRRCSAFRQAGRDGLL